MKIAISLIACLVCCSSSLIHAQPPKDPEIEWFDMEQCAFCKNMAPLKESMHEMPCDTIKVDNGMIMVSIVPEHLKAAAKKANEAMEATAQQMRSGKTLPMCGFCQQIGMLMGQGVKMEKLASDHCEVTFFTSSDANVVKTIHAFADQTIEKSKALHNQHN